MCALAPRNPPAGAREAVGTGALEVGEPPAVAGREAHDFSMCRGSMTPRGHYLSSLARTTSSWRWLRGRRLRWCVLERRLRTLAYKVLDIHRPRRA
jgi:hypothetical protein